MNCNKTRTQFSSVLHDCSKKTIFRKLRIVNGHIKDCFQTSKI